MNINQGEIWLIKFYPQVGSEISKKRPAIVVNHNTNDLESVASALA